MKSALITGVLGQDGAYLSKLLLEKGYKVYGFVARRSTPVDWRLQELGIDKEIERIEGDMTDLSSLVRALKESNADEVYKMSIVTAALSVPEEEAVNKEDLEVIVRTVVATMLAARKNK